MKRRVSSSLIGAGLVGAVVTATALVGAGVASATPIDKQITYTCSIPVFGDKDLNIEVKVDIPATGTVGTPVQASDFTAITPISSDVYSVFTPFGATQVDGTADTTAVATQSDGSTISVDINATIPLTPVPDPAGPDLELPASGPVPPITPTVAGDTVVSLGSTITAHVTPRDDAGNPTVLGTLDVPCTATGDTSLSTVTVSG